MIIKTSIDIVILINMLEVPCTEGYGRYPPHLLRFIQVNRKCPNPCIAFYIRMLHLTRCGIFSELALTNALSNTSAPTAGINHGQVAQDLPSLELVVPNFLFSSVTALSIACWIWKSSFSTQQIGSGLKGLGIGSVSLDRALFHPTYEAH